LLVVVVFSTVVAAPAGDFFHAKYASQESISPASAHPTRMPHVHCAQQGLFLTPLTHGTAMHVAKGNMLHCRDPLFAHGAHLEVSPNVLFQ
jgi:hypothetical protein